MPIAKKLPSGNYRCRAYYTEVNKNGKTEYKTKSFTAPTKREAEKMAAEWNITHEVESDINVINAVNQFIDLKSTALSPSTIRAYKSTAKYAFESIKFVKLSKLSAVQLQRWINELSKTKSPKTVKNTHGLLSASAEFHDIHLPKVSLPKNTSKEYIVPTQEELQKMLQNCDDNMRRAIMLGMLGLRLSEVCALTSNDLEGNLLTINKAKVRGVDGYVIKSTKTASSTRQILIPDAVRDALADCSGELIKGTPRQVQMWFDQLTHRLDLNHFTFHSLRHYMASSAFYNGATKNFIEEYGGWSHGSSALNRVYTNTIEEKHREQLKFIEQNFQ